MRYRLGPWTPQGDSTQFGTPVKALNTQPTVRGSYREIGGFVARSASPSSIGSVSELYDGQGVLATNGQFNPSTTREFVKVFVTSGAKIYEYDWGADTYTDVSRLAAYTASANGRGGSMVRHPTVTAGVIYAMSIADKIQYSSSIGTRFVDLDASAPNANILVSAGDFLLAFNQRTWYCSAIGNPTSWTPSIATQAATGTVDGSTLDIVAAKTLGRDVVVYKSDAMHLGQYVGPPVIWQWSLISDQIGIGNQNSVVSIGNTHYFVGRGKFYIFDGSFPREVPGFAEIRNFVQFGLNDLLYEKTASYLEDLSTYRLIFNQITQTIWIIPDLIGTPATKLFYIYHLATGAFSYGSTSLFNSLGDNILFYETAGLLLQRVPQILRFVSTGSTAQVYTVNYQAATPFASLGVGEFQFGPYGAEDTISHIDRLRIIVYRVTGNVQVTLSGSDRFHGTFVQYYDKTVNSSTTALKFDSVVAGSAKRWHKITVKFSGEFEFDGFDINMKPDSKE
jgi:hypothetical protein